MDQNTRMMLRDWLDLYSGDVERLAEFMRDHLHIGGLIECREFIREAQGA